MDVITKIIPLCDIIEDPDTVTYAIVRVEEKDVNDEAILVDIIKGSSIEVGPEIQPVEDLDRLQRLIREAGLNLLSFDIAEGLIWAQTDFQWG